MANVFYAYLDTWNIKPPARYKPTGSLKRASSEADAPEDTFVDKKIGDIKSVGSELLTASTNLGSTVSRVAQELHAENSTEERRGALQTKMQELIKLNLTTARDCLREFIIGYKLGKKEEFLAEDMTMEQMQERAMRKFGEVREKVEESVDLVKTEKEAYEKRNRKAEEEEEEGGGKEERKEEEEEKKKEEGRKEEKERQKEEGK